MCGWRGEGCPGAGTQSTHGANILVTTNTDVAFFIGEQAAYDFNFVRVFQSGGTGFDANFTNTSTDDPIMGTCKVFIPNGSNLKGAGLGSADIGANVLYRYENGSLTNQPLWSPATGAFPCGAIVAGVNDIPGQSCFDVNQRLNVNTNGCGFPSGYGSGCSADGASCTAGGECCSGNCTAGICGSGPGPGAGPPSKCGDGGRICDVSLGENCQTCPTCLAPGTSCTASSNCCFGPCQ